MAVGPGFSAPPVPGHRALRRGAGAAEAPPLRVRRLLAALLPAESGVRPLPRRDWRGAALAPPPGRVGEHVSTFADLAKGALRVRGRRPVVRSSPRPARGFEHRGPLLAVTLVGERDPGRPWPRGVEALSRAAPVGKPVTKVFESAGHPFAGCRRPRTAGKAPKRRTPRQSGAPEGDEVRPTRGATGPTLAPCSAVTSGAAGRMRREMKDTTRLSQWRDRRRVAI